MVKEMKKFRDHGDGTATLKLDHYYVTNIDPWDKSNPNMVGSYKLLNVQQQRVETSVSILFY
jgi:hypothetical protein